MRTDVDTLKAPPVVVDAWPRTPENSRQGVLGNSAEVIPWEVVSTAWSASGKTGYACDFAAGPAYQAIDDILSFSEGGATYLPLTDALGSVMAITDSSGAVVRRYSYDVYGARTTSGTGPDIPFGFTGREHDASGLRYHRDRYVDPATGKWLQPDRRKMVDGPNLYQYVLSSPTIRVDARGRRTQVVITADPDSDIGTHAALRVDDDGDGEGLLFDPGGHYEVGEGGRGSADYFLGEDAALGPFVEFQANTGDDVYVYVFDTTKKDEREIAQKAGYGQDDAKGFVGGQCAFAVSAVLSGTGIFSDLDSYFFPAALAHALKGLRPQHFWFHQNHPLMLQGKIGKEQPKNTSGK